jgi:hypothetical protein
VPARQPIMLGRFGARSLLRCPCDARRCATNSTDSPVGITGGARTRRSTAPRRTRCTTGAIRAVAIRGSNRERLGHVVLPAPAPASPSAAGRGTDWNCRSNSTRAASICRLSSCVARRRERVPAGVCHASGLCPPSVRSHPATELPMSNLLATPVGQSGAQQMERSGNIGPLYGIIFQPAKVVGPLHPP